MVASPRDDAYVGFYRQHGISPVAQDISDRARHFSRRAHLYRSLGISPLAVRGIRVLEVGPGSGHNALYTASLNPARYVLFDANPRALNEAKQLLGGSCEYVLGYIQDDTVTKRQFNLVLCEGLLPHRRDPTKLARYVGQFVAPGGILVVTTADHVSVLSEVLRRLIKCVLVSPAAALLEEQLAVMRPVFGPHFATLPGASRSLDDWMIDTLVNPWDGELFSIEDAICALEGFEVYGSSPRFLTDWRWYKDIHGDTALVNERAIEQYRETRAAFLDCRAFPPFDLRVDADLIADLCRRIFAEMQSAEAGDPHFDRVADVCWALAAGIGPPTSASLREVAKFFAAPTHHPDFDSFASFFGRGQQYLSFVKT